MKDKCETEIKELNKFFENWYNGIISLSDETFSRLTRVLAQNFRLISPNGTLQQRNQVLKAIRTGYKTRKETQFKIWIENLIFNAIDDKVYLVMYEE